MYIYRDIITNVKAILIQNTHTYREPVRLKGLEDLKSHDISNFIFLYLFLTTATSFVIITFNKESETF